MTPDEVVKVLKIINGSSKLKRSPEVSLIPDEHNAIQSAISLLQDYQKLREICIKPNDGICYVCGKKTDSLAGNPSEWAVFLAHIDGQTKHRHYHVKCLYPLLQQPTEH